MSSSFTDQQPPHDPRHDESYTPTPPAASRVPSGADDFDADTPKLGSLAQKARGNQLKQARIILFIVGALTIVVNGWGIAKFRSNFQQAVQKEIQQRGGAGQITIDQTLLQQEEDEAFLVCSAINGTFILMGVLFLILGAIIYRFPVPVTILSLVLYLLTTGVGFVIAAMAGESSLIRSGFIIRILIVIALAKSIQSALAYEKEKHTQQEFESV